LTFLDLYKIKSNNGLSIKDSGNYQTSRFCIFEDCENTKKQHFPKRIGRVEDDFEGESF
jgi:hypothetical protein